MRLRHRKRLQHLSPAEQEDVLCEMNVIEQVGNVALSTVLQDAWERGQKVSVHGWVYGLKRRPGQGPGRDHGATADCGRRGLRRRAFKRYPRGEVPTAFGDLD